MGLKPKSNGKAGGNGGSNFEPGSKFPVPKAGARRARVSLIVDLGTQKRDPIWEKDGKLVKEGTDGAVSKSQKDAHQLAVFADLVNDVVDYGGKIGEAQYRLMLNKGFKGEIQGINFYHCPPMDNKGNLLEGKKWAYHPQNLLMKLGNAIGLVNFGVQDETDDVEQLLNGQFMADVEVKEVNSGKQDKEGNDIIYRNVNFKTAAKVPAEIKEDDDGNEVEVVPTFAKLRKPAKIIGWDDVTVEDIEILRGAIVKKIKQATEYHTEYGNRMREAIEAWEAENGGAKGEQKEEAKPAAKPAAKPKQPSKPKAPVEQDMADDDLPF